MATKIKTSADLILEGQRQMRISNFESLIRIIKFQNTWAEDSDFELDLECSFADSGISLWINLDECHFILDGISIEDWANKNCITMNESDKSILITNFL